MGMFLEKRLPFLHPFVLWTFRIYVGIFVAGIVGLVVVAPGVLMSKELWSMAEDKEASLWEKRLTLTWCVGAGVIFTGLLAAAYLLEASGRVRDIKLWFICLCFVVLMVPYALIGCLLRWALFRRTSKVRATG